MMPTRPLAPYELSVQLGEQGVCVDVAAAAEGEPAGSPNQLALTLGHAAVFLEGAEQDRITFRQFLDHLAAGGGIGRFGDVRPPLSEPLLLLDLDSLQGRIAQHNIEAFLPAKGVIVLDLFRPQGLEHVQERQVPVKESVTVRQSSDLILDFARDDVRVAFELSEG